ncbi:sulfatase [bacterium]|nr:sulfatase [bacterium]
MNVVLVIFDSLRKDCVGCYKENPSWGKVETPFFDKFSEESLIFDRVYPESLPTLPMRRAIYTGKNVYPFRNANFKLRGDFVGAFGWGPIPEDQDTVSEVLQEKGYRTCLISSVYHQFKPSKNFWRGFDQWEFVRGKENDMFKSGPEPSEELIKYYSPIEGLEKSKLLKKVLINTQNWKKEEDYPVAQIMIKAANWLEENKDAEKLFLVLESFDPHEPWQVPDFYSKKYFKKEVNFDQILSIYGDVSYWPEDVLKKTQANYSGLVCMCDRWFGYLYEKLKNMGLLEDTLIILTADHGHSIGDKNFMGKRGYPSSREVYDIPLLIRHPEGKGKGERSDILINHTDITATIYELCGITLPFEIDGKPFWKKALNGEEIRDHVTVAWGPSITVVHKKWYMNCLVDGKGPFLYDLEKDPNLEKNIADENEEVVNLLFSKGIEDAKGEIPDFVMESAKKSEVSPGCSPIAARKTQ